MRGKSIATERFGRWRFFGGGERSASFGLSARARGLVGIPPILNSVVVLTNLHQSDTVNGIICQRNCL